MGSVALAGPVRSNWELYREGAWSEVAVDGPLIVNSKAFAGESKIAADLQDGHLVILLDRWSAPISGHHLCYRKQRRMAPVVRAYIHAVRAQASD